MKNYEKYADEIKNYKGDNFCTNFVKPNILKSEHCVDDMTCDVCRMIQAIWLLEEYEDYEEPEVDWSKVEIDTPILVRRTEDEKWCKRHFAKCDKYGLVYTWKNGRTSWTTDNTSPWEYAKLAESEEECEEPKVDWSKVKVDTPVLVNDCEDGDWYKRYFAEYENGMVYTWDDGYTSHGTSIVTGWKHAKLVKDQKEPEIDWSKVKVDTPILVRDSEDSKWLERYFAKYEDGLVYAWLGENTSYTTCSAAKWKYAKLVEDEKGDD